MRHAAKRDDTEPGIVKALELAGWTVVKVSDTGFPDLACFRRGVVRFLECKGPNGKLTPAQEETFRRIEGALVTVHVVRTPAEALLAVAQGVEGVLPPLEQNPNVYSESETERFGRGHLVTPAYQQAQTAAVVPPKKKRKPPSCECGHGKVLHQSFFTACVAEGCACTAFKSTTPAA